MVTCSRCAVGAADGQRFCSVCGRRFGLRPTGSTWWLVGMLLVLVAVFVAWLSHTAGSRNSAPEAVPTTSASQPARAAATAETPSRHTMVGSIAIGLNNSFAIDPAYFPCDFDDPHRWGAILHSALRAAKADAAGTANHGRRGRLARCPKGPGGSYPDLRDGAAVSVRDADGSLIGAGVLEHGRVDALGEIVFAFHVADLPETKFYQLSVGSRPPVTYTLKDISAHSWRATLEINE